ncbi:MarR family winged helix-turn-helix transcriptional regulator [Siccirubricoccus phaeus]|uniref:MarR family winged helix-turn-helix transcriptional regulator n=1 Tax=Siccirubricoccus phaeus TaxID=2595053 RepID=UPI001A9C8FB9|nr:MarR family transcriptional regulator [Siccirubricoccus phaeus]
MAQGSSAEAAAATVAEAVQDPELRQLMERLPLWRRPGFLVRRLHQIHTAIFAEECQHYEITPVQYAVLTTLSLRPGIDQAGLAQEVGIDRTNVADVLARLAQRGLVKRQRNAADRRAVLARLTPEGEKTTRAMLAAMRRAQERFLEPLDAAEREQFMALLLRLVDANNGSGRAALGPAA